MRLASRWIVLGFVVGVAACDSATRPRPVGSSDLSAPSPDLAVPIEDGQMCSFDYDCLPGDYHCVYPIANGCSAVGHCAHFSRPVCTAQVELCGCNGKLVISGCEYPGPYASAPTLGAPYTPQCSVAGDGGI